MTTEQTERLRLNEDPEVLAYQFIQKVKAVNGEIRFGGTAYIRDGLCWEEIFAGVANHHTTQFVNDSVIVWRVAKSNTECETPGFQRY